MPVRASSPRMKHLIRRREECVNDVIRRMTDNIAKTWTYRMRSGHATRCASATCGLDQVGQYLFAAHHALIRRLQTVTDGRPRFSAPLHAEMVFAQLVHELRP